MKIKAIKTPSRLNFYWEDGTIVQEKISAIKVGDKVLEPNANLLIGTSITVIINNVEYEGEVVSAFSSSGSGKEGPVGPTGPQGPQGEMGPTGPQGPGGSGDVLLNMLYAGLDVNLNTNSDTLNYVKEHINDFFVPYAMVVSTDDIFFVDEEGLTVNFNEDVFNLEQLSTLLQQATIDNFPLVLMDSNYNRMVMSPSDNGADVVLYLNDRQYVTTITVEFNEDETGSYTLIIGELAYVPIEYQNTLYPSSSFNNIPNDDYNYRSRAMRIMLTDETLDFGEVLDGLDYLQLIQAQVSHNNSFFWGMINKNFNYIRFMSATERRDHSVEEPFPLLGYDLVFKLCKDGHYYLGKAYYDLDNSKLSLLEDYCETDSSLNEPNKRVITYNEVISEEFKTILDYFATGELLPENAPIETIINFKNCKVNDFNDIIESLDVETIIALFASRLDDETGVITPARVEEMDIKACGQAASDNNFQHYYGTASFVVCVETVTETGSQSFIPYWLMSTTNADTGEVRHLDANRTTRFSGHMKLKWRDDDLG